MCWNQVENEKNNNNKVEKESWREKEIGRFWKVESREKKKREKIGIYGYTCVVEKNQEKKERKKKRNVWMIKRKKGKII